MYKIITAEYIKKLIKDFFDSFISPETVNEEITNYYNS